MTTFTLYPILRGYSMSQYNADGIVKDDFEDCHLLLHHHPQAFADHFGGPKPGLNAWELFRRAKAQPQGVEALRAFRE